MVVHIIFERVITFLFSCGLFINALLFLPQAAKLLRLKDPSGLSLITFIGFCLTQLSAILYGIIKNDYVLSVGYSLSLLTCGFVTFLLFLYRKNKYEQNNYK